MYNMRVIEYLEELLDRKVEKYIQERDWLNDSDKELVKERLAKEIFDKLVKDINL